ncbi:MAG: ChrB protein [Planctomycetota bacterium]|nr:MAG: ChrB protein [Planctomycetota bacterium]
MGRAWLLLIHQLPPEPAYLRVKVRRRLQQLGALALKNTVYVLPASDAGLEDFQWLGREIVQLGGEAFVCEAAFLEGLSDASVRQQFLEACSARYHAVREEAVAAREALGSLSSPERLAEARAAAARLGRSLEEIATLDFFGSGARSDAEAARKGLEKRILELEARPAAAPATAARKGREKHRGRTWVTRSGVYVDRIASAWLIRRFIDPQARFRFVSARGYRPAAGELRFDMSEAEFTHEGENCTFEVLLQRFGLSDPGLTAIAELVHDLDLKDGKFGRPESAGIERMFAAIAAAHRGDEERLARGGAVLDDLYQLYARKGHD